MDFNEEINSAFDHLFEKAQKGEVKVGNPKYRQMINEKGHKVYVLANPEEHPKAQKHMNEEEFEAMFNGKQVERHYDEPPIITSIEDLKHATFISDNARGVIIRAFQKVKFYENSIRFAKAIKNEKAVEGHTRLLDQQKQIISSKVNQAFNNQNVDEFGEGTFDDLKSLAQHADGYSLKFTHDTSHNGFPENVCDYMNQNYANFDVVELTKGIIKTLDVQKKQLEKQGIPTTEWKPRIKLDFNTHGFDVNVHNDGKVVTDEYGWKNDLTVTMSRSFSGTNDDKGMYHSIFVVGEKSTGKGSTNPLRGGFAKSMMQNFYKQYKNTNLKSIKVNAAAEGFGSPYCGSNTWGRWGFRIRKSEVEVLLAEYRNKFSEPKQCFVDEQVVFHNDPDLVAIRTKDVDGNSVMQVVSAGEGVNDRGRQEKTEIKTRENTEGGEPKFKTKVTRYIEVTPQDVSKMEQIFIKKMADKHPQDTFRVKDWYEKLDNDVVRAVMSKKGWAGKVDLTDEAQVKDFESNLFKVYGTPATPTQLVGGMDGGASLQERHERS